MQLDDAFRYGQSKSGSALLLRDRVVGLLEFLEQLGLISRRNPRARVVNGDAEGAVGCGDCDCNFTGISELDRIADEVEQDLR